MEEETKRNVCKTLGCDYDKCDWRGDGHDDGYGGYSEKFKNYEVAYVDTTPTYHEYKKKEVIVVDVKEDDEKENKILTNVITSKVEDYPDDDESEEPEPEERVWKDDGWKDDGWKDDGHKCDEVSKCIL